MALFVSGSTNYKAVRTMVRVFRLRFISVLKNIISRLNNTLQAERETSEQGVEKFKCLQSLFTPMQHFRRIFSVKERTKNHFRCSPLFSWRKNSLNRDTRVESFNGEMAFTANG